MSLHHIIYLSRAVHPFSDEELQELLLQARQDNSSRNITGALVYGNEQFAQIIEGEATVIAALYERLLQDPRHTQLVKFADKTIEHRSFADWSMAFHPVSAGQMQDLTGYVSPKNLDFRPANLGLSDTLLLQMMKSFVLP